VRLLAGELAPLSGECLRSPDLRIGYFAQHQLEQLDPAASPLQHFSRLDPRARESELRDYLGSFNFRGNGVFDPVAPLSGGEKARLALALVVYPRPNLLLLDEPTNHLDLDLRQALELALQEYVGAVILVSHDRHLVANVCDTLWTVADHRVQVFDGDLDDYARWLAARRSGAAPNAGKSAPARTAPAERRRAAADQRAEERSLRDQVRKLDTRISRLGERLTTIEQTLADTTLYEAEARARLDRLLQEQRDHRRQLDEAEEAWLAAAEALETLRTP
jgi:ATPase components of ABC transporters with duplicated ATPase domains